MKIKFLIASFFLLIGATAPLKSMAEGEIRDLRVMSFNVRHLEGIDNVIDASRTAAVINRVVPDVALIQEIDSVTDRSGKKDQMAELGKLTGMFHTFGRAIDFGGGGYGIGILSRQKPLDVKRIPLPGDEPRLLLVAEFKDYVVACTHLALEEDARMESVKIIAAEMKKYPGKPFMIGGDWNATPSSPLLQAMREYFNIITPQTPTFPADKPVECLDYIAVDKDCVPEKCCGRLLTGTASDHRAVSVTVSF